MKNKSIYFLATMLMLFALACKNKPATTEDQQKIDSAATVKNSAVVFSGLYSASPDVKSFKECGHNSQYWITDSSAQLELQYSQLNLKPEEPAYVQVEGKKVKTKKDGVGGGYDSTLVVTRLVKITKDIPKDGCN